METNTTEHGVIRQRLLDAMEQCLAALPDSWFAKQHGVDPELIQEMSEAIGDAKKGVRFHGDGVLLSLLRGGRAALPSAWAKEGGIPKDLLDHLDPVIAEAAQAIRYRDFLVGRLFESNGYGDVDQLLEAIHVAGEIDEDQEWRAKKDAFNRIGEAAPMREDGFMVRYQDVPAFLDAEVRAWIEANPVSEDLVNADRWREAADELQGALDSCVTQIEQMKGLFNDEDGNIQSALDEAEQADGMYRCLLRNCSANRPKMRG